jgi:hypothetical protein
MRFHVRVTGNDWWEKRVYYLSQGGLEREGMFPALKELDKKFRETLTMLFKPETNAKGKTYAHGDTGNYLTNLHSLVTSDTLKIVEGSQKGGREILEGGRPGTASEIIAWAKRKLGVPQHEAEAIARALKKRGRVGQPNSPMMMEHPTGAPRFAFPEWIVTRKNRKDIDDASKNAERFIVRYLN